MWHIRIQSAGQRLMFALPYSVLTNIIVTAYRRYIAFSSRQTAGENKRRYIVLSRFSLDGHMLRRRSFSDLRPEKRGACIIMNLDSINWHDVPPCPMPHAMLDHKMQFLPRAAGDKQTLKALAQERDIILLRRGNAPDVPWSSHLNRCFSHHYSPNVKSTLQSLFHPFFFSGLVCRCLPVA